jgi:hypothetical protein
MDHQHGKKAKPETRCELSFASHVNPAVDRLLLIVSRMIARPEAQGECDTGPQSSRAINLRLRRPIDCLFSFMDFY